MAIFTQAILSLKLDDLSHIQSLLPSVCTAARQTTKRLVVILFCDAFNSNDDASLDKTEAWGAVQTVLTAVYVEATRIAYEEERILMDVDVLLRGTDTVVPQLKENGWEAIFRAKADNLNTLLPPWTTSLRRIDLDHICSTGPTTTSSRSGSTPKESPSSFPVVALGGTFDHLHSGHKILLSMAAWIADEKLIVGVTDDTLLQKKAYKELLETLDIRIARVRAFLDFFKPGLFYDIVPINDVYGPTAVDPNIQALVVSKETESGATSTTISTFPRLSPFTRLQGSLLLRYFQSPRQYRRMRSDTFCSPSRSRIALSPATQCAVAKKREDGSLPALKCFVIDVVSTTSANLDAQDMEVLRQTKMSSTSIREYLASSRSRIQ